MDQSAALRQLLAGPQGKRLLALLQQDGGKALHWAAEAARQGDTARVQQLLGPMVEQPEVQRLLKSMGQQLHG